MVIANLLFLEEHVSAILPALQARRADCDAMIGVIADSQIVKLTRMGTLDMSRPDSGLSRLMKRLRGADKKGKDDGARKMKMLRRLPRILRLIPGKAQDLRAWFLVMQYWLGASDENVEEMLRFLIGRYCRFEAWRGGTAAAPTDYPDTGLYHPDLPDRITTDAGALPRSGSERGTVGLLMMRSYVLRATRRITMPSSARSRRAGCGCCRRSPGGSTGGRRSTPISGARTRRGWTRSCR